MTGLRNKTPNNPDHPAFKTADGKSIFDIFKCSASVRAGDFLYVAGQGGLDPDGAIPKDDITQFRNAFGRVKIALESAGASLDDIVELISYHIGMLEHPDHMAQFREVKDDFIFAPFPTWTNLEVSGLSRIGLIIEIKAIAYCPINK